MPITALFIKAKNGFLKWSRWILDAGGVPRVDLHCAKHYFGSHYGGYSVATGFLNSDSVIYSFGIGKDISFENALQQEYQAVIHLFDPTPESIQWVKSLPPNTRFVLHAYGLSDVDGTLSLFAPQNANHISHSLVQHPLSSAHTISVPVKRLETIMAELAHSQIHLLKMDIEGAEYSVIEDIAAGSVRPEQIVLEFHHHFPEIGVKKTLQAIKALRNLGYRLFSYSIRLEEFSFIHQSKID
jgi:FkbM family methyltransferase